MNKIQLLKRIYRTQIKKYIPDLLIILVFMILNGAATAGVAWLLDPAIKKIFIEKNQTMLYLIPIAIIFTFLVKSVSLYFTRIQSINISFKIKESIQKSLANKILNSDLSYINENHSGKFIAKHNPKFKMAVKLENTKFYEGVGESKKKAEQNAAKNLLNNLEL